MNTKCYIDTLLLNMLNITYSSILAWRILWTEEPLRLQSMGSQRVAHSHIKYQLVLFIQAIVILLFRECSVYDTNGIFKYHQFP